MIKFPKILEKGSKYGDLTVICSDESSTKNIESKWKYKCRCSCGNIISVKKNALCTLSKTNCGCKDKKINPIEDCGEYIKIFFFNKNYGYTIVDAEDYNKVKNYCWCNDSKNYAIARPKGKSTTIKLHRLLFDFPKGMEIDHKDGNGLNNRRNNLRLCNRPKNGKNKGMDARNTSGYCGASKNYGEGNKWRSRIYSDGKEYLLGVYYDIIDAAYAYEIASKILHKNWGRTNQDLGLLNLEEISLDKRKEIEYKVKERLKLKGVKV
jgi:hypothetical protein